MSFGLRPFGTAPYGLIDTPATVTNYTMTAETGVFTLTGNAVQFGISMPAETGSFALTGQDASFGISMPAGTGEFVLTGNDAELTYTPPAAASSGGGLPARRKRKARDATEGNRDFLGSRRNSRPGIAEEEMREVLATVKSRTARLPVDDDEDEDEEAILWLL